MSRQISGNGIRNFLGIFGKVSSDDPQPYPHIDRGTVFQIESLVVAHGMLVMNLDSGEFRMDIPPDDLANKSQFDNFADMMAEMIAHQFDVHEHQGRMAQCLRESGLMVRFDGDVAVINPLTQGFGEVDNLP